MPIQGFNSIEEQNKEQVIEMYGTYRPNLKRKIISRFQKIPYLCDETGQEFEITWRGLNQGNLPGFHQKHLKKLRKRFLSKDKEFVAILKKKMKNGETLATIAKELECSFNYLRVILEKAGEFVESRMNYFSNDESNFIKENYSINGADFCAEKLNRPRKTIVNFANRKLKLKIIKPIYPENYTKCYNCKEILPLEKFCSGATSQKQDMCKKCKNHHGHLQRLKNLSSDAKKRWLTVLNLFQGAKNRSIEKNLPFDLTKQWIDENLKEYCPVLNLKYLYCQGKPVYESPSIDRLLPEKGYLIENCRIISFRANLLKNDATLEQINQLIDYLKL